MVLSICDCKHPKREFSFSMTAAPKHIMELVLFCEYAKKMCHPNGLSRSNRAASHVEQSRVRSSLTCLVTTTITTGPEVVVKRGRVSAC